MLLQRSDYLRLVRVAVGLTVAVEVFYLIVWGVILFPEGPFLSKLVWITTCGVAMGSVIAVLTIAFVVGRLDGKAAMFASAGIVFAVGTFCTFLCSRIDVAMNLWGGAAQTTLFIWGGMIPALAGGLFYGWLLYTETGRSLLTRLGI